ncbi:MAG: hypothetical protein J3Q66DRAFT_403947 [Benniella sp.]|nr:MAG: hypothetical protein J3Q66DRAFT_403947 [Benniella sp.]
MYPATMIATIVSPRSIPEFVAPTSARRESRIEMAENYTKRANLALRLDGGFADKAQELQRYSQVIQIPLYGKVDMDPSTKQTSILVTQYLQRAEELKDATRQREAAYEYLHRLDMPRLQAGNADGSGSGSGQEDHCHNPRSSNQHAANLSLKLLILRQRLHPILIIAFLLYIGLAMALTIRKSRLSDVLIDVYRKSKKVQGMSRS